jgi:electron transport complex protein RnfB
MALIGAVFGLTLGFLDKKLKVEEDPLVADILSKLPGVNCGACGLAGCAAYAKKVAETKNPGVGCMPGGKEVNQAIADMLGVDIDGSPTLKLIVKCGATDKQQKRSFEYRGPASCAVAHASGGNIDCRYGCLGLGDCVRVCPVNALSIHEGRIIIDNVKCIDCGACVRTCPRKLFQFVEIGEDKEYCVVACSNPEDTMATKKVCSTGCIGCGICVKLVKDSPFELKEKLSVLNYTKARGRTDLDVAIDKCPVKIIEKRSA